MRVCALIMKDDVYGRRIVENICERGFSNWIHWIHEFEVPLAAGLLDNPEEYLPKDLPECDLILSLGLPSDLQYTLPVLARRMKAKAVIVPIDDSRWIPPGLRRQIEIEFSGIDVASVFPKPFCSLEKTGDPYIDAFAEHFGRPKLEVEVEGDEIRGVRVKRGSPCGSTWFIAEKLVGVKTLQQRVRDEVAKAHHVYPCLASMITDSELNDTVLHNSQYLIRWAIEEALKLNLNCSPSNGDSNS